MKILLETKIHKIGQIPQSLERIILIRHADSEDRAKFAQICNNDLERPLSKKGKAQSKKIAEFLKFRHKKSPISLIISSPAKRTKQTIKPFLKGFKGAYKESESIAPDCTIKGYVSAIESAKKFTKDCKILALVGHQLDLGDFVEYATGVKQNLDFKKGVIVEIAKKAGAKQIKGGFIITLFITPDYL